jgi:hypothetical protein
MLMFTGCDQQQGQILALRDEFQRQLQAKDKTIEDLRKEAADLHGQNIKISDELVKAKTELVAATQQASSPEKIAGAVADVLAQRSSAPLNDIASKLDLMQQSLKGMGGPISPNPGNPPTGPNPGNAVPGAPVLGDPTIRPSDGVRKSKPPDDKHQKLRFDF